MELNSVILITNPLDYGSPKPAKAGERKVMVKILWGTMPKYDPENVKNLLLRSGTSKP